LSDGPALLAYQDWNSRLPSFVFATKTAALLNENRQLVAIFTTINKGKMAFSLQPLKFSFSPETMLRAMARLTAALALLLPLEVPAEDWPQFRGPNRDGVWNETGIIESFPPGGLKISWRAPVGPGFSSPVVAEGRVFVTDSQVSRPKARERVLCFDAKTGKNLWIHSYEADYADWAFDPKNPFGPRPTPIVSGSRVFTLGARGRLCCISARNGKVIWKKDFENKSKDSAFTPSPLIEAGGNRDNGGKGLH
jgi:hypothetical protein